MTRAPIVGLVLAMTLGLGSTSLAVAQSTVDQQEEHQLESRIVNVNGEVIQLTDGTVVRIPHSLALQNDLREGRRVKLRYHLQEGEPVARSIEFLDEAWSEDRS